jgi:hypothetical protein
MMAGMEISRLFAFDSSHIHTICFSHIQAMKTHTFGALTEVSFQIVISMCSDFWRLGYHWACLYNSTHWRYVDKLLRITRRRIACFVLVYVVADPSSNKVREAVHQPGPPLSRSRVHQTLSMCFLQLHASSPGPESHNEPPAQLICAAPYGTAISR